jgi:hypothetical protein
MTIKKTDIIEDARDEAEGDMLPEYRFDYGKARPNRFAEGVTGGSLVVVLEPELAQVFKTSEQVRAILRAIAGALPHRRQEP